MPAARDTEKKLERLRRILADLGSAAVAFSGGTDSSFLLRMAVENVPGKLLSFTFRTPFVPAEEIRNAVRTAGQIGVRHKALRFRLPGAVMNNPPERCYFCKRALFSELKKIARREGCKTVIEGSNRDDLNAYRPGRKALRELGIRSPLAEAGLTKAEIRFHSRRLGLPGWDKPSASCLATRLPYGEKITREKLAKIRAAESMLHKFGFGQVRLRLHGDAGRIEVAPKNIPRLVKKASAITRAFRALGIGYACADLKGYRSGSLDEVL